MKPGGVALYHNLDVMTCDALAALVPARDIARLRIPGRSAFAVVISTSKRWPAPIAFGISYLANGAALLKPFDIPFLCPMLVLEVTRSETS